MATWKRSARFSDSRRMSYVMMILIVTDVWTYNLYWQYAHQTETTVPLCYIKARREKVLFVSFCVPQTMLFLCHLKTGPVMQHLWTAFAHSLAYNPCVSVLIMQHRMPSWFQNFTEQEEMKSHSHEHSKDTWRLWMMRTKLHSRKFFDFLKSETTIWHKTSYVEIKSEGQNDSDLLA